MLEPSEANWEEPYKSRESRLKLLLAPQGARA
jgi:hypothetical protein